MKYAGILIGLFLTTLLLFGFFDHIMFLFMSIVILMLGGIFGLAWITFKVIGEWE